MNRTNGMKHIGLIVAGLAAMLSISVADGLAQTAPTMDKYTWNPVFINKAVPPNILFIVDLSDATIPAAYGSYPISSLSGTVTAGKYAANVNLAGTGGLDLVSSSNNGVSANTATTTSPSDTFNSAKSYYGIFDPLRCYSAGSQNTPFTHGSVKGTVATDVSNVCGSSYWDGNFLNWLGMRKKDVAYQAVVGGTSKPAQSNTDGTANVLQGENVTGQNGTNNVCNNNSNPCWRYVKFVPTTTLTGRVPTGLVADAAGAAVTPAGRFFGLGEGQISVNQNSSADPFDGNGGSAPTVYQIAVDLRTEPNVPSGTGNLSGNCTITNGVPDANFAGHLICYQRDRSLGLFQKLRLDNMHVGVMFAHADTGQAGNMQFSFDDKFVDSAITNIRNEHIQTHAPIAEALYEGLCVYRNAQGACYNNNPADFTASVNTKGDPYWFCTKDSTGNCAAPLSGQSVSCCKSFVLMISPGIPDSDDNSPNIVPLPFGNLFAGAQIGVTTSRLDDVAFYGQTNDVRPDLPDKQNVTFYAVNAMGGAAGATLLASAAKYGGFTDMGTLNGQPDAIGQPCTYPPGSNLGSGTSTSSPEWDVTGPQGGPDCIPDTYFDASEGTDLETQVNLAIADILKKAASGTSASVLASSSTGEGALYQAFFFPGDNSGVGGAEIKWTGYTRGLFVDSFGNLREDTNGDGKLVYSQDNIIQTRFANNEVVVDRYADTTPADGKADSTAPFDSGVPLRNITPIWEAGRKLADLTPGDTCTSATAGVSCRHLLTWIDVNADGHVQASTEPMIEFKLLNKTTLKPYLRAGSSPLDETGIINFIRGCDGYVSGSSCPEQQQLRDRRIVTGSIAAVWKYGDPIDSTPTIVADPKERYDVIYGDSTYGDFYKRWKGRRQIAYVGANDGMLHAFNAGFYNRGDDPSSTDIEHGWFSTTGTGAARGTPALGAELWGFIPYHLLPHLQWLARNDYDHVYYVDLKPKVTDVRIFADDGPTGTHPGGWGTILIGGMRFGGSCGNCGNAATPMTYQADFNNDGTIGSTEVRTFYSAYFVLDITDPEHDPVVIAIFEDPSLGLTTSYPAVLRVNPSGDVKTSNVNAKWFAIFGSGPNGYDGRTLSGTYTQTAKVFAMELKSGSVGAITTFPTADTSSFMGDLITVDNNLDYRVDVAYGGNVISNGTGTPKWFGSMYRLTTASGSTTAASWGYSQAPTTLLSNYCGATCGTTTRIGPITAAATVTVDDSNHLWVYFGTGRFFDSNDKTNTDVQSLYGVKDPVLTGGCSETSITSCAQNDLLDVSSAQICITCASMVSGVSNGGTAITSFDSGSTSLVGTIQGKHGWRVGLTTSGERALSAPVIIGGSVFFTSFTPSTDICAITGNGSLYGLYYLTGTAYKESTIGTSSSGGNTISSNKIDLGTGLPSQMAVHLGAQGTGSSGSAGVTGCTGGLTGIIQTSTGALNQVCGKPALSSWSRYISWNNERD